MSQPKTEEYIVRVKGVEQTENEDLPKVVSELLELNLAKSKIEVLGRRGQRPVNKLHILLKCPSAAVLKQVLENPKKLPDGVEVVRHLPRDVMVQKQQQEYSQYKSSRQRRSILVLGLPEMQESDEEYVVEWFFATLIRQREDSDAVLDDITECRRLGQPRWFGARIMRITFGSDQTKEFVMNLKDELENTRYKIKDDTDKPKDNSDRAK